MKAALTSTQAVDAIQCALGKFPPAVCPLTHRFTPGLYTREIFMPAGSFVVSKIHKTEHPFVILKGVVSVWTENGGVEKLSAHHIGITKPGTRRVLYTHEDTIWATFHVTKETDLEKIEAAIISKHTPEPITPEMQDIIMNIIGEKGTPQERLALCLKRAGRIVKSRRSRAPKGFDPSNSWVAVGVAAVSIGAGAYGASESAGAAKSAAAANLAAVKGTNDQNLLLNLYSRGVPMTAKNSYGVLTGSMAPSARGVAAAVLPYYFGQGGESGIALDTLAAYRAANAYTGNAAQSLKNYADILAQYQISQKQADQAGANLFNGNLEDTLMADAQPVWDQNIKGAETQIQAGFQALAKTLNNIDAIQAKKGFTGDTSGSNMLKFSARQTIGQEGAAARNNAMMQNLLNRQGIRAGVLNTQLSNINLPTQQAQSAMGRSQLPLTAFAQEQQNKQAPFAFFKMGQNQFQPVVTPVQGAIPTTGQIIGNSIGSLATGIGSIFQQRKQDELNRYALADWSKAPDVNGFLTSGNLG